MNPRETLEAFDRYLAMRGFRFEAIVIGGATLNLLVRATLAALGRRLGHGL